MAQSKKIPAKPTDTAGHSNANNVSGATLTMNAVPVVEQKEELNGKDEAAQLKTLGGFDSDSVSPPVDSNSGRHKNNEANGTGTAFQFKANNTGENEAGIIEGACIPTQFKLTGTPVYNPVGNTAGLFKPIQKKANNTGLPDNLKAGVESLSGFSMDDVKVYRNSDKPAQLNAHAYAQGTDIHLAPGQEQHLPHEAWHVAQQKQGRVKPTMQMKQDVPVNDDPGLEHEADVMGAKAISSSVGDVPLQSKTAAVNKSGINPVQLTKVSIIGVKIGKTGIYNWKGKKIGHIAKGSEIDIDEGTTKTVGSRKLVKITSGDRYILWIKPDMLLNNPDDLWISQTRYTVSGAKAEKEEAALPEEEDVESIGTIDLGGGEGEEDGDSITIGKDGFKISVAGQEISLSKNGLKQKSGGKKEFETPSLEHKIVFPIPLGPLAPLALTISLGFKATTTLSLEFEEEANLTPGDLSKIDFTGTGTAGVEVESSVGVGVGLTAGIATVAAELIAALKASATGTAVLHASVGIHEGMVNAGATATLGIEGDISAALKGAVTLAIGFFSKEFSLTFKEWKLGEFNWEKEIASIGQKEPFLPSKADLGVTDEQQEILKTLQPTPTATQEKWIKKILADFNKARKAAASLREQGIDLEDPDFWSIIDSYENENVYKIQNRRIVRCSASEAMPLLVSTQVEQAISMLKD